MTLESTLSEFRAAYTGKVVRLALVRGAWVAVGLLLLLVTLDAVFAFNGTIRAVLLIVAIGTVAVVTIGTYVRAQRSTSFDRMLARLVESRDPTLENTLVNALDFRDRLARDTDASGSAELMQLELHRAERRSLDPQSTEAFTPTTYRRERLVLSGAGSLAIVLAILFWPVMIAVLPRLFLPWGDFPPYSRTRFAVEPGAIRLDYGENLKVSLTTSGVTPESVQLVVWDDHGKEIAALPMFHAGESEFFQTIENVQQDLRYFTRITRGRSKRFPITVIKNPRVEEVIVTYVYPPYTRTESQTRMLTDNVLRGYVGTRVELTVRSNRPLEEGTIRIGDTSKYMRTAENDTVSGSITIDTAGTFAIDIVDNEGNTSPDAITGTIEILPDNRPEVAIVSPGTDSFAVPDAKVPIEISAMDDLGIAQVAIFRNHNASRDARKILHDADEGHTALTVVETLNLEELGVRPGDMLEYYATASDNRPGAAQSAASPTFRLQIISHEEYREYLQMQTTAEDLKEHYDQMLDALRALAQRQQELMDETEALQNAAGLESEMSPEQLEQLAENQAQQSALAQATNRLAEALREEAAQPAIFDIETEYKQMLQEFAERLEQAQQHMDDAERSMGHPGANIPNAVSEQGLAMEQLAQNVDEFQSGIQAANENLENVVNVVADAENFKYLYTLQKGLERQIRYYREKEDPTLDDQIRLKELSEQQALVREALSQLKENFRDHADELEELALEQEPISGETVP